MDFPMHGDGADQGVSIDAIHAELMRRAEVLGIAEEAGQLRMIEMRVCSAQGTPSGYTAIQILRRDESARTPGYGDDSTSIFPYRAKQHALRAGTEILFELYDAAHGAEASEATEESDCDAKGV